jgi:hypothetical protein
MRRNDFVLVVALLFLTCVGDWLSPAPALAQPAGIAVDSVAYRPNLKFALAAEARPPSRRRPPRMTSTIEWCCRRLFLISAR